MKILAIAFVIASGLAFGAEPPQENKVGNVPASALAASNPPDAPPSKPATISAETKISLLLEQARVSALQLEFETSELGQELAKHRKMLKAYSDRAVEECGGFQYDASESDIGCSTRPANRPPGRPNLPQPQQQQSPAAGKPSSKSTPPQVQGAKKP